MTKIEFHPCYILHQRPYRETSLIIEVFSREHGRVGIVAKGAKRGRNPQRAILQPLRALRMAWTLRGGEMGTLTGVEPAAAAFAAAGPSLFAAFYVNELLMRMLHRHEPHVRLFDAYTSALTGLQAEPAAEATLRIFEKQLLECLGYGLVLDRDVVTGRVLDEQGQYHYLPDRGPTAQPDPGAAALAVSGSALQALRMESLSRPSDLSDAKRLLRTLLAQHLGDRPLASRRLYREFLRNRQNG
jgi:DNA repair protein RecO (recombination protein O)